MARDAGDRRHRYCPEREVVPLTRARFRVNTRTRWEENTTRKYHVASFAMMSKIIGTLDPGALNFLAKNVIKENARESEVWILSEVSVPEI